MISTVTDLGQAESLGESGLLVTDQPRNYVSAVARDYQVIDVTPSDPVQLATVKGVRHRVTNDETGTTFLLGSNGAYCRKAPQDRERPQDKPDADRGKLSLSA
jgi:hypothetical protein